MYAGFHSNLVETLKDKYGNALINKDVSIYFNGMNSILSTDHNGQVTLRISNVGPNTYNAAITFVGDDIYASATKTVKITVKNLCQSYQIQTRQYRVQKRMPKSKLHIYKKSQPC